MYFDDGAVQTDRFDLDLEYLFFLKFLEGSFQNAISGPAAHPHIYRVPISILNRESTPLASVFGYIENCIEDLQVADSHVASLHREARGDAIVLLLGEFHSSIIPNLV